MQGVTPEQRRASMSFVVAFQVALLGGACDYAFGRRALIVPGEISGTAVRQDDAERPSPFASVALQGGTFVRRTRVDGGFVMAGLPAGPWVVRLAEDEDGDGNAERTAFRAARIAPCAGCGAGELGGVLLGDVGLDGAFALSGTMSIELDGAPLPDGAGPFLGRVVVTRELCVPGDPSRFTSDCAAVAAADVDRISVGVEALAAVDSAGTFVVPAIGSGPVFVYALAFESNASEGGLGRLVAAAPAVAVTGLAGRSIELAPIRVDLKEHALGPVEVTVRLAPPPVGEVRLIFSAGAVASCGGLLPLGASEHVVEGAEHVRVTTDPGIVAITACAESGSGVLTDALVLPAPDADAQAQVGPIFLRTDDGCGDPRDCDGDGLQGLPLLSTTDSDAQTRSEDVSIWQSCVAPCAAAFGTDAGAASCTANNGQIYDCDDDGDGQPDVTEASECYGPGLGTDLDGDGECSRQDAFPSCADNDPTSCPSFQPFTPPPPSTELTFEICLDDPEPLTAGCRVVGVGASKLDGVPTHREVYTLSDERYGGERLVMAIELDEDRFGVGAVSLDYNPVGVPRWLKLSGERMALERSANPPYHVGPLSRDDAEGSVLTVWSERVFGVVLGRETRLIRTQAPTGTDVEERYVRRSFDFGKLDVLGGFRISEELEDVDSDCAADVRRVVEWDDVGLPIAVAIDEGANGNTDFFFEAVRETTGCPDNAQTSCTQVTLEVGGARALRYLARLFDTGRVDTVWLEETTDGAVTATRRVSFERDITDPRADRRGQPLAKEVLVDGDAARITFAYDDEGRLALMTMTPWRRLDDGTEATRTFRFEPSSGLITAIETTAGARTTRRKFTPYRASHPDFAHPDTALPNAALPAADAEEWVVVDGCTESAGWARCSTREDCAGLAATPECGAVRVAESAGAELVAACSAPVEPDTFCGPALVNGADCAGICDAPTGGKCAPFCVIDADCAEGRVCVDGAYGVLGNDGTPLGVCMEPCEAQSDCLFSDFRSCVLSASRSPLAPVVKVCDGHRGLEVLGAFAAEPLACRTNLLLPPEASGQPTGMCTQLCTTDSDCADPLPRCATSTVDASRDTGWLELSVCAPSL